MPTNEWVPPASVRTSGCSTGSVRRYTFLSVVVMALLLNGCQGPAQGNGNPGGASPYVVTGSVVNSAGTPLAGVEVFADNTLFYDNTFNHIFHNL